MSGPVSREEFDSLRTGVQGIVSSLRQVQEDTKKNYTALESKFKKKTAGLENELSSALVRIKRLESEVSIERDFSESRKILLDSLEAKLLSLQAEQRSSNPVDVKPDLAKQHQMDNLLAEMKRFETRFDSFANKVKGICKKEVEKLIQESRQDQVLQNNRATSIWQDKNKAISLELEVAQRKLNSTPIVDPRTARAPNYINMNPPPPAQTTPTPTLQQFQILDNSVSELQTKLTRLELTQSDPTSNVDDLHVRISQINNELPLIKARSENLGFLLTGHDQQFSTIKSKINALSKDSKAHRATATSLGSTTATQIEALTSQLTTHSTNSTKHLATQSEKITSFDNQITSLSNQLKSLTESTSKITLAALEEFILKEFRESYPLESFNERIMALVTLRVGEIYSELESAVDVVGERTTLLEKNLLTTGENIDKLQGSVDKTVEIVFHQSRVIKTIVPFFKELELKVGAAPANAEGAVGMGGVVNGGY